MLVLALHAKHPAPCTRPLCRCAHMTCRCGFCFCYACGYLQVRRGLCTVQPSPVAYLLLLASHHPCSLLSDLSAVPSLAPLLLPLCTQGEHGAGGRCPHGRPARPNLAAAGAAPAAQQRAQEEEEPAQLLPPQPQQLCEMQRALLFQRLARAAAAGSGAVPAGSASRQPVVPGDGALHCRPPAAAARVPAAAAVRSA
jgi:hypothetical protein